MATWNWSIAGTPLICMHQMVVDFIIQYPVTDIPPHRISKLINTSNMTNVSFLKHFRRVFSARLLTPSTILSSPFWFLQTRGRDRKYYWIVECKYSLFCFCSFKLQSTLFVYKTDGEKNSTEKKILWNNLYTIYLVYYVIYDSNEWWQLDTLLRFMCLSCSGSALALPTSIPRLP